MCVGGGGDGGRGGGGGVGGKPRARYCIFCTVLNRNLGDRRSLNLEHLHGS